MTVMLKPLMPMVSDCYAHAFDCMSHIATVHAQYGSNHVQKELEDMTKGDSGKSGNTTKNMTEVPVHVAVVDVVYNSPQRQIKSIYFPFSIYYFPIVYLSFQAPPPRFYC